MFFLILVKSSYKKILQGSRAAFSQSGLVKPYIFRRSHHNLPNPEISKDRFKKFIKNIFVTNADATFKFLGLATTLIGVEHYSVKSYRLQGSIEGIRQVEEGAEMYLQSKDEKKMEMLSAHKIREGLALIERTADNYSLMEIFLGLRLSKLNPNRKHDIIYTKVKPEIGDLIRILNEREKNKVHRVDSEIRAHELLKGLTAKI